MIARALATFVAAYLLLAAPAVATTDHLQKVQSIRDASATALNQLIEHRDNGTLDEATALGIIQETFSPQFDFGYLTMLVIGKHWRKASDDQKATLTTLYRELLERTYSKSLSKFKDQQIEHLEPEASSDGTVSVGVNVLNRGKNVLIEYRIKDVGGAWTISDVKIENVSLLSNFRRQFNTIIRKDGIDGLVELLRDRA